MSSQYQQNALLAIRAKLDPQHPGFRASDEIAAALKGTALAGYLNAWVYPLIDTAMGLGDQRDRANANSEGNSVRLAIRRKARVAELEEMRRQYVATAGPSRAQLAGRTWDGFDEGKELLHLKRELTLHGY